MNYDEQIEAIKWKAHLVAKARTTNDIESHRRYGHHGNHCWVGTTKAVRLEERIYRVYLLEEMAKRRPHIERLKRKKARAAKFKGKEG